ncbi:MAG TPA: ATP-binding cassette domain-containing protein [Candidatus Polarisedimenticolaceae bacterium]
MHPRVLLVRGVSKRFVGRPAVENLSFEVHEGEVFALLGPNGAGKTTTVRMIVGILAPDEGRIELSAAGHDPRATAERIGYLPEDRGLYRDVPVLRTLVHFGRLRGLERREAEARARAWLERVGLLDRIDDRVDALSKGNQQRVQLIASILHRPALAILDEPFSGLDPLSQDFFVDLVRGLRDQGTTVLLSAHQMDLVERVADRVLLLNRGREILSGSMAELRDRLDSRPRVRLTLDPGASVDALRSDPDVDALESVQGDGEVLLTLSAGAELPRFLARAVGATPIRGLATERPRLHDVFVRAVRADDASLGGGEG